VRWYGKELVKVNRYYGSFKICSVCGFKNENIKLKDRYWTCPNCGTFLDRDLNASINILKYYHQSSEWPNRRGGGSYETDETSRISLSLNDTGIWDYNNK